MALLIALPPHCQAELRWICAVLFGEFLGVEYRLGIAGDAVVSIEGEGRKLVLPDVFFARANSGWNSMSSLPVGPVAHWDVMSSGLDVPLANRPLPVLFGKPEMQISDEVMRIGVDILGTAFFMLSRYEEAVLAERDEHDRFPATASIAHRCGFLDRPVVDEYVEVLWAAMRRLWPSLERKIRRSRTLVSCDVDSPYVCGGSSLFGRVRRIGGDLLKRRSLSLAMHNSMACAPGRQGNHAHDPYLEAIDRMMELNERAGNRVAFYFIAAHSHPTLDGCYHMDEPVIRNLLRRIAARGHEIGLHASYNTYQDEVQTCLEAGILRRVMENEGIEQQQLGGRQHFLRWQTPMTACNLEAAGIDYDSTLSFADRPGFRCGTCHEYPMYDLAGRRALKLRQRPLIVMECSVIADRYLGLRYSDEALELMQNYKRTCHRFSGDFTLLWHNSHFMTKTDHVFYAALVGAA